LSSHILHTFTDELVRTCLTDLYERVERSSGDGGRWKAIMIELMKFSSVEPMFSSATKRDNMFAYYDGIRVFGNTRNNPDYWLQLGIASTVFDDLPRGKLCFKNAYERERAQRNPNLTRIDNYSSRFEMRCAVSEPDANTAFRLFIDANERLTRQIFLDINRHYPFKTGRYFADIAAKHYRAWNEEQKVRFKDATVKIREKAKEWKASKREFSADVELLIKETSALLKRIDSGQEN
jgi:hypothetical protein